MVGGFNGGHNTKMMVEDYPGEYDGRLAGYGITSHLEWMGSNTGFIRNFDAFASRIADIVARRTADPNWNPITQPLSPPLTPQQIQALLNVYTMPAHVRGSPRTFNFGRFAGSEYRWGPNPPWPLGQYDAILGYATTSVAKFDRFYAMVPVRTRSRHSPGRVRGEVGTMGWPYGMRCHENSTMDPSIPREARFRGFC